MFGERESRRQRGELAGWNVRAERRNSLRQVAGERREFVGLDGVGHGARDEGSTAANATDGPTRGADQQKPREVAEPEG